VRAVAIAAFIATTTACLFPSTDGLSGGAGDAGDAGDAGADGGSDASTGGPVTLASTGNVNEATGNAQQAHVVWAAASKQWWLFYLDGDMSHLKTRSSSDFVTWTDGASLTLPHPAGTDARNFAVAYASLGGADVVHVSFSHVDTNGIEHSHTRAVIQGGTIAFDTPIGMTSDSTSPSGPDGPVPLIASDGSVWDSTGFVQSQPSGHFNEDVFLASSPESGAASWAATFAQTTVEVVNQLCNARAMVDVGKPLALWESGDPEPDPNNVRFATYASSWSSPANVFPSDASIDPNDWDVAVVRTGTSVEAHAVRAQISGGYDHVSGTSSFGTAAAPPPLARTPGSGLVLLADPANLAAFDLASDGSVEESRWDGAQWSAWTTLATSRSRNRLSGYCPDLGTHPEAGGCALVWTEPASGGYAIVGTLVRVAP
jgi:hypothetical protein